MSRTGRNSRHSDSLLEKIINSTEPLYVWAFVVSFISWGIVLTFTHSEADLSPIALIADVTGATVEQLYSWHFSWRRWTWFCLGE